MKCGCPHCNAKIGIDDADIDYYRGQKIQCPRCGEKILMDLPEPEPAIEKEVGPEPASRWKKHKSLFKSTTTESEPHRESADAKNKATRRKLSLQVASGSTPSAESFHQRQRNFISTHTNGSPLHLIIVGIVFFLAGVWFGLKMRGEPPVETIKTSSAQTMNTQAIEAQTMNTQTVEAPNEPNTPSAMNNSTVELSEQDVLKEASQLYQTAAEQENMGADKLDANDDLIQRGEKKSPPDEDAAIELIWKRSEGKVKELQANDLIRDANKIKAKFELIESEMEDARVTVFYEYSFFDRQGLIQEDYDLMVWSHHPKELIWKCTDPLIPEGSEPDLY